MIDEVMLKGVSKAFSIIKELNEMSFEDLVDICEQYGEKTNGLGKNELILLILKNELTSKEFSDYQKYVNYCNFRQSMTSLDNLNSSIDQIQAIFKRKSELAMERNRAENAKREVEFALFNALPLVRLNISYSHVESDLDNYINKRTKSGMHIASLHDEIDYIKSKNLIYRILKKNKMENLEKEKHDVVTKALLENDSLYQKYVSTVKNYGNELKSMFYKMLDNRLIANSVYLYRNMEMDASKDDFYKLNHVYDAKFTLEEKEEIFEDFLASADFDPERDVTGPIFYEAVKKYVTKYYSVIASRISLKQSELIAQIKDIVKEQKETIGYIYQDMAMQYGGDALTFASIYEEDNLHVKRKK